MKRILLLVVMSMAVMAWYRTQPRHHDDVAPPARDAAASFRDHRARASQPEFHCDGRRYCSQMRSRAEAEFFLRNCPDTRMDGDHDGVPCENDSRF